MVAGSNPAGRMDIFNNPMVLGLDKPLEAAPHTLEFMVEDESYSLRFFWLCFLGDLKLTVYHQDGVHESVAVSPLIVIPSIDLYEIVSLPDQGYAKPIDYA